MKYSTVALVAVVVIVAAPLFAQVMNPPTPVFGGALIQPDSKQRMIQQQGPVIATQSGGCFRSNSVTLKTLVAFAYDLSDFQISGGPDWAATDRFDIESQISTASAPMPQRVQSVLAEKFHLQAHRQTHDTDAYRLVIVPGGPNSTALVAQAGPRGGSVVFGSVMGGSTPGNGNSGFSASGIPFANFVNFLAAEVGEFIVDLTSLSGPYKIQLHWARDADTPQPELDAGPHTAGRVSSCVPMDPQFVQSRNPSGPSIFTAIEEQLGLRLEPTRAPVEFLVIDSAEKPPK